MNVEKPYLTIVATTRNDNHGGDLLKRTETFVRGIYEQARKWNFPLELIIVEWNPPQDKPLLHEELPKPDAQTPVSLKYVIVPPEVHQRYRNASTMPLYQMIAKNVGIRRAKGEYILCTNIDILFSDGCFAEFARKKFKPGYFYRSNRCDIPKEVMEYPTLAEQLTYAENNIIKRMGKSNRMEVLVLPNFLYAFPRVVMLLNDMALRMWKKMHKDGFPHFTLDFDACGDFTLMSRQDWLDIEGYVELDMYSIHIDSMALWSASALGKKQHIFPHKAPIYHIYHEDGWESTDALRTIKFLEHKPCLDYSIVFKAGMQIVEAKQTWGINKPGWGMEELTLQEFEY